MSYTRSDIELARAAAARRPGDALHMKDIPPDAPYQGRGPLYVWTGETWLDVQLWIAMNADPRRGEEEVKIELQRKPPERAKAEIETGWLFEEEAR